MSNRFLLGTLGTAVAAGAVVVAAINGWIGAQPDAAPEADRQAALSAPDRAPVAAPVPEAAPEAAPAAQPEAPAAAPPVETAPEAVVEQPPAAAPLPAFPSFDLVRAEPDGNTLVAGQGFAGGLLEVLVDGAPQAETEIGGDGKFVAFLDLAGLTAPAVLTLRMTHEGSVRLSDSEVIIAPPPPSAETIARAMPEETPVPQASAAPGALAAADVAPAPAVLPDASPAPEPDSAARPVPLPSVADAPEALAALADQTDGTALELGEGAASGLAQVRPAPVARPEPGEAASVVASVEAPDPRNLTEDGPVAMAAPEIATDLPAAPAGVADPQLAARGLPSASEMPRGESGAPTVLLSGPRGVEVLQTAPIAPGEVALDAISYDEAGEVLLSGRGEGASFVRVYLDNAPLTTARIRDDGRWRLALPEVDSGTYTLRVDQLNAAGEVTARVESPFLRESAEVLEQAAATGPITSITVQPGNTLWGISRDRYGDGLEYIKVYRANRDRIRDPDLIYPGQIFDLPLEERAASE